MRRSGTQAWAVCAVACVALAAGCVPPPNEADAGVTYVALIIDTSASVSRFSKGILQYAQMALEQYTMEGQVKVAVINLNEAPSVEFQTDRELFPDDIAGIVAKVGETRYDAKGTDIVSALDLVVTYCGYESTMPNAVKVLCFTDGYIDNAPGQTFRRWEEADLSSLAKLNAQVGLYFIDTDKTLRGSIQTALRPISQPIVKNWKEAQDELDLGAPTLP